VFTTASVVLELLLGLATFPKSAVSGTKSGADKRYYILGFAHRLIGLAWAWIFNDQFGVVNDIPTYRAD